MNEQDCCRNTGTINILVVDDDKTLCGMLKDILSSEKNLNVTSAHDGLDAIEKIKRKNFDLVLSDLMMPGADGIEVLKTAKMINSSVHVIIITGFSSLETAMEAMRKGAYDYITKPFKLEEIKIAVQNACEKIELLRQNQCLLDKLRLAYEELESIKRSRRDMNASSEADDEEVQKGLAKLEDTLSLPIITSDLPPSYYLRRRRTDRGYVLIELEKLGKLRDEGVLTEKEFQSCKHRFLSEIEQ